MERDRDNLLNREIKVTLNFFKINLVEIIEFQVFSFGLNDVFNQRRVLKTLLHMKKRLLTISYKV